MKNAALKWVWLTALGVAGCATQPPKVTEPSHLVQPPAPAVGVPEVVGQGVVLPKPQPAKAAKDPLQIPLTVVATEAVPVKDMLFAIARDARIPVDIHPGVSGSVNLNAIQQPLGQILARIADQTDIRWKMENGVLAIMPDEPYFKTYAVDYVNVTRSMKSNINLSATIASASGDQNSGNASTAEVGNASDNKFWESLEDNIRTIVGAPAPLKVSASSVVFSAGKQETVAKEANTKEAAAQTAQRDVAVTDAYARLMAARASGAGGEASAAAPTSQEDAKKSAIVVVNRETGTVMVRASQRQQQKVQEYLDTMIASAQRQVLIEATLVEVELSDTYQTGIDWSYSTKGKYRVEGGQTSGTFVLNFSNDTSTRTMLPGTFNATLSMLEEFGKTKVLSSPKIMALNNQTAILKAVEEKVYFALTSQTTPATTTSAAVTTLTSTIKTAPVGVVMSITPQIGASGEVSLTVRPTITRITDYVRDPAVDLICKNNLNCTQSLIPQIQSREIESTLKLVDGQTAVLGGLIQDELKTDRKGVPGLSRLPWLGDLFSYRDDKLVKSELVIFIRPIIVKNPSLQGDLEAYRTHVPESDFFTRGQDEVSVFRPGLSTYAKEEADRQKPAAQKP